MKTVALVAMHKSTRDLAPWDNKDVEIWGLNEAYVFPIDRDNPEPFMRRWDRWFQIHSSNLFQRADNHNDPLHYDWLKKQTGFPIYMQKVYEDIPASVKYPIKKMVSKFGNYFASSVSYMMALAIMEGFERIELYGIHMGSETEYKYQRANMEYLIGWARGMGIQVMIPTACPLCKGAMYGYDSNMTSMRQRLEFRLCNVRGEFTKKEKELQEAYGMMKMLTEMHNAAVSKGETTVNIDAIATTVQQNIGRVGSELNSMYGSKNELEFTMNQFDQFVLGDMDDDGTDLEEEVTLDDVEEV